MTTTNVPLPGDVQDDRSDLPSLAQAGRGRAVLPDAVLRVLATVQDRKGPGRVAVAAFQSSV